jgi:hypothetical protein
MQTKAILLDTKLTFPEQNNPWLNSPEFKLLDEPSWHSACDEIVDKIHQKVPYRVFVSMQIQVDDNLGGELFLSGEHDRQVQRFQGKVKGMRVFLNEFFEMSDGEIVYSSGEDLRQAIDRFLEKSVESKFQIAVWRENPYFSVKLGLPCSLFDDIRFDSDSSREFMRNFPPDNHDDFLEQIDRACLTMRMNIADYGLKINAHHIYPTILNNLYYKDLYSLNQDNLDFEYFERCRTHQSELIEFLDSKHWTAGVA